MKDVFSLDIETSPDDENIGSTFGLEPWRQDNGTAFITSVAIAGPDNYMKQVDERSGNMGELPSILKSLEGKIVVAHNAIFDLGWITVKHGFDSVKRQKWKDTMLAAKWIHNGQNDRKVGMSLKALVERYLPDHPLTPEFLDLKMAEVTAGVDYAYWLQRGKWDAELTRELYIKLLGKLPSEQHTGYHIEQRILPTVANSWVVGLELDMPKFRALEPRIKKAKKALTDRLGVAQTVISSPQQLRKWIEEDMDLVLPEKTATGTGSTGKESLMKLHLNLLNHNDERFRTMKDILDFKQLNTMQTKFINGANKCTEYLGEPKSKSTPRIFGTYTGRFTYSNKVMSKHQVGLATHQLPRKGPIRSCIIPPPGYKVLELDAAGQEMRFMAHFSQDDHMVNAFKTGMNLHSSMGAAISGDDYEDFQENFKAQDKETVNHRYAGKLLNLSCQYRISGKALAGKFFSNYQIVISEAAGRQYEGMYKRRYPGVPKFWKTAIKQAQENGYAESIAKRRYHIDNWTSMKWGSESSAINFPIQGSGADHKDLAIAYVAAKFPELIFVLDLHDGLWYLIPEDYAEEHALEARDALNKLNFSEIWNVEDRVKFTFDAQLGDNFLNIREL
jgi:DNA polymerase I-like protein with 3'-5' exonuclease and polymerase domains